MHPDWNAVVQSITPAGMLGLVIWASTTFLKNQILLSEKRIKDYVDKKFQECEEDIDKLAARMSRYGIRIATLEGRDHDKARGTGHN